MLSERISGERVILRRPRREDAQAIHDGYAGSAEVTRYLSWPRHRSRDDTLAFLAQSDASWQRWHAGPLLIEEVQSGSIIGSTGVSCQTPYRVAAGYVLAEPFWGRGFALEALQTLLEALRGSSVWRVEAVCHTEHRVSARLLERAGFDFEGTLRRHTVFPNLAPEPQDVLIYARVLW
jgi:RimJ/RimL family protein N-acetyltransferase